MTGNGSADEAMQWLFQHMEDEDIGIPFSAPGTRGAAAAVADMESLNNLMRTGFEEAHARKALQETVSSRPSIKTTWRAGTNCLEREYGTYGGLIIFSPCGREYENGMDIFDTNANAMPMSEEQKVTGYEGGLANYNLRNVMMHKDVNVHAEHYVAFVYKHITGILMWRRIGCCLMMRKSCAKAIGMRFTGLAMFTFLEEFEMRSEVGSQIFARLAHL